MESRQSDVDRDPKIVNRDNKRMWINRLEKINSQVKPSMKKDSGENNNSVWWGEIR